jgi:hypothetical protein
MTATDPASLELAALLRTRLAVIANHAWRDSDSAAHLNALKEVSLAIEARQQECWSNMSAKLRHYMERRSYDKALAYLEGKDAEA